MNSTLDELDFGQVKDLVGNPENIGSQEELLEKIFQVFALCSLDHGCLQTNRKKQATVTELWRFASPDVSSICQRLADEGKLTVQEQQTTELLLRPCWKSREWPSTNLNLAERSFS